MTVELPAVSTLTAEAIISLEQSYAKVPWEQARRYFRNELKVIDKDLAQLCGLLVEANLSDEEKRGKLLGRVQALIEKLRQQQIESRKYRSRTQHRLSEIQEVVECASLPEDHLLVFSRWQRNRAVRLVAEYLLQKGCRQTAFRLADQHGLQEQIDGELYEESARIKSSLRAGHAAECLAWCSENRANLKKLKSPIEFILRRQEFVELVRVRDLAAAIGHAKKHFPGLMEEHELEIEQALALLAINAETEVMPYKWLYDPSRWGDIAQQFDRDNHLLHGLPDRPQLVSLVHAGLSTLKTPQCLHGDGTTGTGNINCPVCTPPLAEIAKLLPFAHHETSLLVCPITGAIMDADNAPMALPNGNVYSLRALEQMAATMGGNVVCPRTNATYRLVEARKCFIS